jgi:hypothetical protein
MKLPTLKVYRYVLLLVLGSALYTDRNLTKQTKPQYGQLFKHHVLSEFVV